MAARSNRDSQMIDVIIAAKDEADTIGPIVDAFRSLPEVSNVIVSVNGSSDDTYQTSIDHGAYVVWSEVANKGLAVHRALSRVTTDRVVLCDGDLIGFTAEHAQLLSQPYAGEILGILDAPVGGEVGRRARGLPAITGERALPTNVLRQVPLYGYAMEIQLNAAVRLRNLPVMVVSLDGVTTVVRAGPFRAIDIANDMRYMN